MSTKDKEKGKEEEGKSGFKFDLGGLGGIFKGLGEMVEKLGELAEKGAELRREGQFGDQQLKGVYGFTVKVGGGGAEKKVTVEPFGNLKKDERGRTTVSEEREPVVDLFDEADRVLVLAELPGVDDSQVQTELAGDVLTLTARAEDRKYRKEVLLPRAFEPKALSRSFRNGVLKVELRK